MEENPLRLTGTHRILAW